MQHALQVWGRQLLTAPAQAPSSDFSQPALAMQLGSCWREVARMKGYEVLYGQDKTTTRGTLPLPGQSQPSSSQCPIPAPHIATSLSFPRTPSSSCSLALISPRSPPRLLPRLPSPLNSDAESCSPCPPTAHHPPRT